MKDDLPYFSHDNDARNHAKMKALRARFGWTGYGQFWALNEMIAGSSHACLDLSRKVVRAGAACELGMTTDALEAFLAFLADRDECGLIDYDEGIVTTDRTQEDYARTETGRERKRAMGIHSTEKRINGAEKTGNGAEKTNRIEENRIEENREETADATNLKASRFTKPRIEEVKEYCDERGGNVDPQRFFDHYESNGWRVGKAGMKDWKAAVRTWERNAYGSDGYIALHQTEQEIKPVQVPEEFREMMRRNREDNQGADV